MDDNVFAYNGEFGTFSEVAAEGVFCICATADKQTCQHNCIRQIFNAS